MKKKLYIIAAVVGFAVSILGCSLSGNDDRPIENVACTSVTVNEYESVSGCFETPFN